MSAAAPVYGEKLADMTRLEPMSKLVELSGAILAGQVRGRIVIGVKC